MTFTRTASGIQNYAHFFRADLVVFAEGSDAALEEGEELPVRDAEFYEILLSNIIDGRAVKVKCVGNKRCVIDYAEKIESGELINALAVADRDYDFLHSSPLPMRSLFYTCGYSWESDFWSSTLAEELVRRLTDSDAPTLRVFKERLPYLARRLRSVSALDAACRCNGTALFRKNGRLCGIGFTFDYRHVVRIKEFRRLVKGYRAICDEGCHVCSQMFSLARRKPVREIVQGHLWESALLNLIRSVHRERWGESVPHRVLCNLALSIFRGNPEVFLEREVYEYYRSELQARI